MRALLAMGLAILLASSSLPAAAEVLIDYVGVEAHPRPVLTFLDPVVRDEGLAGARLAIADSEVTARFTRRHIRLAEYLLKPGAPVLPLVPRLKADGAAVILAALPPDELLRLADAMRPRLVINVGERADSLRRKDCRANLLHTIPSDAMLADGLAQYLAVKSWSRWALVIGPAPEDEHLAAAFRHAAEKFGSSIVEEKRWSLALGQGRADTGHVTLQAEIPPFTRMADHDVLVVADTGDSFGEYLSYRTDAARPVAGTHGLVATGWSPVLDQWGAAQLQDRFRQSAGRPMTEKDYAAWLGVSSVAEAANRTGGENPAALRAFITGDSFELAGFKGQALSYRPWDGQLRQPILLAGPRLLVSVSPQAPFLQQGSDLDSLGDSSEDGRCVR